MPSLCTNSGCTYGLKGNRRPTPNRTVPLCIFCSPDYIRSCMSNPRKLDAVIRAYRKLGDDQQLRALANQEHIVQDALKRNGRPLCRGCPGEACIFKIKKKLLSASSQYIFCGPTETLVERLTQHPKRVGAMIGSLPEAVQEEALNRIPDDQREKVRKALSKRSKKVCIGRQGDPCIFGDQDRISKAYKHRRCHLCMDTSNITETCSTLQGLQTWVTRLQALSPEAQTKAMNERVPAAARAALEAELRTVRSASRASMASTRKKGNINWFQINKSRRSCMIIVPIAIDTPYRKGKLENRRFAINKLQISSSRLQHDEQTENDVQSPAARRPKAMALRRWCQFNSWSECDKCGTLNMRALDVPGRSSLLRPRINSKACFVCNGAMQYSRVQPNTYERPKRLLNLPGEIHGLLFPLEIDTGWYYRENFGYRQRTAMIRFAWKAISVKEAIANIADADKASPCRAAYRCLTELDSSDYASFTAEHEAHIEKHGTNAPSHFRKKWARFLETPGMETASWTCIFYKRSMCLTIERNINPQRKGNQETLEALLYGRETYYTDPYGEDIELDPEDGRHSVNRLYCAVALAQYTSVSLSYYILHFAFALQLWTSIGAKTSLHSYTPKRFLLAGETFSPEYWEDHHFSTIDIVRQKEYPKLF